VKCKEQRTRKINVGTGDEQEVVVSGRRSPLRMVQRIEIRETEDRDDNPEKLLKRGCRCSTNIRPNTAFRPIKKKRLEKMLREHIKSADSFTDSQ
jgi:hypothetical protein